MNILNVNNLTKKFGTFTAVDTISFSLKEGEILGLLGPNGAGKTTSIQMLLGVLTPTSGSIHYFDKNLLQHREEILEQVNFSSTYTNLPWALTVHDNLTFISYLYAIPNRKKKIQEIIEIFKLKALLSHRMSELSAGQMTRVNLAKAFINNPKVLLLDEPTASLDPDIAQYIREFILEERKKSKLSIIFTSHNMPEVEMICDRVLFINQGKIIADDTPEKLAKTITVAHIHLVIPREKVDQLKDYCKIKQIPYSYERPYTTMTVQEKHISVILQDLIQQGIIFDEISIDKPTLEDYFLSMAREKVPDTNFEKIV
jgi:ABC-2 type transport system ATP-binding protein